MLHWPVSTVIHQVYYSLLDTLFITLEHEAKAKDASEVLGGL